MIRASVKIGYVLSVTSVFEKIGRHNVSLGMGSSARSLF